MSTFSYVYILLGLNLIVVYSVTPTPVIGDDSIDEDAIVFPDFDRNLLRMNKSFSDDNNADDIKDEDALVFPDRRSIEIR